MPAKKTSVYLIGAGPGDAGLLTVRGKELLESCDVIVYDYLANKLTPLKSKPNIDTNNLEDRCVRIFLSDYKTEPITETRYLCYVPEDLNSAVYIAEYEDEYESQLVAWHSADKGFYEALINLIRADFPDYSMQ